MKSSGEVRKGLLRRAPVEGAHGKTIVLFIPNRKLSLEVIKGIELVRGIEVFVVLAVAPLDLPVVSGGEDPDSFEYRVSPTFAGSELEADCLSCWSG